jgi:plasmid replication initiation protein
MNAEAAEAKKAIDRDREINRERNLLVVKDNLLIQKARYSLTAREQKLILYIISKIKNTNKELSEITIDLNTFCDIVGIERQKQNIYDLCEIIRKLQSKTNIIEDNNRIIMFNWIGTTIIERDKGIVKTYIDNIIGKYFINLYENFTKYQLENILCLKNSSSIRIYELCISHKFKSSFIISLSDLKTNLALEDKYNEYKYFNRDILANAKAEINRYTDIYIEIEGIKEGRKVASLKFTIRDKTREEQDKAFNERYIDLHNL